jgi:putative ATP-dependent endonuclease of OLD family
VDIDALVAAAREELGLNNDTGKPLIARYIARKLTSRSPPVVPPSLKRIIEKAVAVTWKKTCLQVPGSPVVSLAGVKDEEAS